MRHGWAMVPCQTLKLSGGFEALWIDDHSYSAPKKSGQVRAGAGRCGQIVQLMALKFVEKWKLSNALNYFRQMPRNECFFCQKEKVFLSFTRDAEK
jgi:hypothetical protein